MPNKDLKLCRTFLYYAKKYNFYRVNNNHYRFDLAVVGENTLRQTSRGYCNKQTEFQILFSHYKHDNCKYCNFYYNENFS